MRFTILLMALLSATLAFGEHNFSTIVTTSSTTVSPPSKLKPTVADIGSELLQGDVVLFSGKLAYMALGDGTVTSLPTGQVEVDIGVLVRKCVLVRGRLGKRQLIIFEAVSGDVWWTIGDGDAVVGKGIQLKEGERMWIGSPGALKCISEGSAVISTQELF